MPTSSSPRVVLKFGGSSVSSPASWERIAGVLRKRMDEGKRVLVVHSALAGITDQLERLPAEALAGRGEERIGEILARHLELAAEVGLDGAEILAADREELMRVSSGIALLGEATPRIRARILAFGERMATRLTSAFLRREGLPVHWLDVRELLVSGEPNGSRGAAKWLNATCSSLPDPELRIRLDAIDGIALTQGFTARSPEGDTVVLGRGGSDTAAGCLAARIGAERLEIWSDVPGMFTADPQLVPTARLLRRLDYREAQEIATTGSRVLHPACIPAVRDARIPIHLRSTLDPDAPGTVISAAAERGRPQVKAISRKKSVTLISMETAGMWQEVGFLARAFAEFSASGLSIDLVSTSETNVTVSLDGAANLLDAEVLDALVERLSRFCQVRVIRPCAAISLVGERIRALLHRLGPAFEVFEEHPVHLISQAASDLNLTFVVDEEQAERLVRKLHFLFIPATVRSETFGPSWERMRRRDEDETAALPSPTAPRWWRERSRELLEMVDREGSAYVYHLPTVDRQLAKLRAIPTITRVFYAMKANPNPRILERVHDAGVGFECVSEGELKRVFSLFPGLDPARVLFTPNFAPRSEYADALDRGVHVTLDALHPLEAWPDLFRGKDLFLRVDPGWGSGHHEKVVTGGEHAKFGVPLFELEEVAERVAAAGGRIVGLHTHSGSGILAPEHWGRVAALLSRLIERFPEVSILNLGGGMGIPERPEQEPLDLERLSTALADIRSAHPTLELWIEPGRFIVAEAGVLLARVTQTKGKGEVRYVGVSTGMNSLIRPALYGAWHEIVNLSRLDETPDTVVQVVGPICESGDRFGIDRALPPTREGDLLLIGTAGAYGHAMASRYNLREPAEERVLE